MSSIMTFIEGYMNGDAWEELCVSCYRLKYQTQNYTAIPAVHGGDAGIEGFTCNGIASALNKYLVVLQVLVVRY